MARLLNLAGAAGALAIAFAVASPPAAIASSSTTSGQQVFMAHCAVCHSNKKEGGSSIGPHLFGVVGRKAGSIPGFAYSVAMRKSGLTWTEDNLKDYVANPRQVVPGNRMPFAGLHNQQQLDALADYLATLK
ncbi:c-type cytochrome [Tsuneonella mangrovi]|uniref:c-type cytochrome n=1 Tax=Tsuneonella mangrovi TaxID=1982042 RepID=UPI000BA29D4F|nr:c-type cytochrome [Tsuneonella mangrovi]